MKALLEVCVDSVAKALSAAAGGAQRLEFCAALEVGGLTPLKADLREVVAAVEVPVFSMIRPRAGDFVMCEEELRCMHDQIRMARAAGARGLVLGVLSAEGRIDESALDALVRAAHPLPVTFHRAFDGIAAPLEALETLIGLGVRRLLTAGHGSSAWQGRALLAQLVERAGERLVLLPGGGVRQEHVMALLNETGAREVHSSRILQLEF